MSEFVIREAKDEDGEALAALLAEAWSAYDGCVLREADRGRLDRPATRFAEADGRLWVVFHGERLAGSLGVLRHSQQGAFELSLVCLDKASRGRGLATALLAGADAFAAASGGEALLIWIDARLVDGASFLERHGFVKEPGVRQLHDGTDALETRYARAVGSDVSSPPSEDLPADAG